MLVTIIFSFLVLSAGYAALRLLGLAKGAVALGLVPAAGLAVTAIVATWSGLLRASPPIPGILVLGCSACGCVMVLRDREPLMGAMRGFVRQHGGAAGLLAVGMLIPIVSLGLAFAGMQAPLSPHDGAFHVETTETFRRGAARLDWYPPGLAALFGGVLQVLLWVDTAAGTYDLGLGLSLLAPLVVFGLGVAVWRSLLAASAATVLVGLTYIFPYFPQLWGGWPQLLGLELVIGLWTLATAYVDRPSRRGAVLAGLLVGAMVVVHGTELYTSAIVLIILAVAKWRQVAWGQLPGHLGLALAISLSCAAPYLPALLHWAGTGGAYQVGQDEGAAMQAVTTGAVQQLGVLTLDALGVDLPVRAILLPLGVAWAIRRRTGRILIVVAGLFLGLAAVGTFLNGVAVVRTVYAATYPWSVPYRHLTVAAVPLAVLGGAGCVVLTQIWQGAWNRLCGASQRRARRLGRLLVPAWLIVATWAVTALLAVAAGLMASFSADDAAAMGWLRQHAAPGEVMVNDAFADAGIWAPYKAGVGILRYESFSDPATDAERWLIEENVAGLDRNPNAAAAACRLNVRYVYRGAQNSAWHERRFPPLEELRASGGLEEVFSSGGAAVFRTRLGPLC